MSEDQSESPEQEIRKLSRRSFTWGAVATVSTVGALKWVSSQPSILQYEGSNGIPDPLRRVLDMNGQLAESLASDKNLAESYPPSAVGELKVNELIGMDEDLDTTDYRVRVEGWGNAKDYSLADIMGLTKTVVVSKFKCIEGWSTIVQFAGCRFSDFMALVNPSQTSWGESSLPNLPKYAFLATPSRAYYVGLDMKALLHPQTLIAWELNGRLLTEQHGAPLRLFIPTKYGIKNIKRLGYVRFQNDRPTDYWYERGYDWYAGH